VLESVSVVGEVAACDRQYGHGFYPSTQRSVRAKKGLPTVNRFLGSKQSSQNRMKYVRLRRDLDRSLVLWPLTRAGTGGAVLVAGAIIAALVLAFELCNNEDTCSSSAWSDSVWGTPYSSENGTYCERIEPERFMAERMNSLSNLAFISVGLIVAACGAADAIREGSIAPVLYKHRHPGVAGLAPRPRNHIAVYPIWTLYFAFNCVLVGVGSFIMHAHGTRLTQQLDVGAIFCVLTTLLYYVPLLYVDVNLDSGKLVWLRSALLAATIVQSVFLTYYKYSISAKEVMYNSVIIVICGSILAACVRKSKLRRHLFQEATTHWNFRCWSAGVLATGSLLLSALFLQPDPSGDPDCDPDSALQLHAWWHFGCSVSYPPKFSFLFFLPPL